MSQQRLMSESPILNGESVEFAGPAAVNEIINQRHHNAVSPTRLPNSQARVGPGSEAERFSELASQQRSFSSIPKADDVADHGS